jgi:hypothetical protein
MTRNIFLFLLAYGTSFCHAEQLTIEIVDEAGRPLPARVRIRDESGTNHFPADALKVPLGVDQWFITPGTSHLQVPSGSIEIRAEHGLEFRSHKETFVVKENEASVHRITLTQWIDMRELGFLCGENHLHVALPELAPQLVAEGLDFGTSLQWWNARRFDVPTGNGYIRDLKFAGVVVPTTVFDYEIEHHWGAVYVVGQPSPLLIDNHSKVPNLPTLQQSHAAGALVCYQGGWSREVLLDALLGTVDVVNLCNNNFLRHAYQPRSIYSNLLEVPGFPTYANNATDMLRMNTDTYYRLLNCGLRLAAGAGSATGPKRSPVGYNRTYVYMEGNRSHQEFLQRWREGKNFVTNGPMLLLTVDDRFHPGDTIELDSPDGKLNTKVSVFSSQPISSIEIIVNGQVVHQATKQEITNGTFQVSIEISQGAWLAARCTMKDKLLSDVELSAYQWGSERMPRKPTRLRFAHTSPIYINLDGQGVRIATSIREAEAILDALEKFSHAETSEEALSNIEQSLKRARKKLLAE